MNLLSGQPPEMFLQGALEKEDKELFANTGFLPSLHFCDSSPTDFSRKQKTLNPNNTSHPVLSRATSDAKSRVSISLILILRKGGGVCVETYEFIVM